MLTSAFDPAGLVTTAFDPAGLVTSAFDPAGPVATGLAHLVGAVLPAGDDEVADGVPVDARDEPALVRQPREGAPARARLSRGWMDGWMEG